MKTARFDPHFQAHLWQAVGILIHHSLGAATLCLHSSIGHRGAPLSAQPAHVSWRPVGDVLHTITHLTVDERWDLIRTLSQLSRHFDWGVEPVVGGGGGVFLHSYFSSVVGLHDPTTGQPNFWQPGFLVGGGEAKRREAYESLMRRARGWCRPTASSITFSCMKQSFLRVGLGWEGRSGREEGREGGREEL